MNASENLTMTRDEVWSVIAPLKKSTWYGRTRIKKIKTPKDWSRLYVALAYAGLVHDSRIESFSGGHKGLLREFDFESKPHYAMSRGQHQSFTYRANRIQSNSHWFLKNGPLHWAQKFKFDIDYYYPVVKGGYYNSTCIGFVVASDFDSANNICDMLYKPLVPNNGDDRDSQVRVSEDRMPVLFGNVDYFVHLMAAAKIKLDDRKKKLQEQIANINEKIEELDALNGIINLNMCAYGSDES